MDALSLSWFFLAGLAGGAGHCVGMCSPFVLWIASRHAPGRLGAAALVPHVEYNLGRTITYAALGAAAGGVGSVVQWGGALLGVEKAAAILAGAVVVGYAAARLIGIQPLEELERRAASHKAVLRLLRKRPSRPILAGLALGLLPCGLSWGAILAAVGTGGPLRGAACLAAFGLGTVPALLALGLFGSLLAGRRGLLSTLATVAMLALGVTFLVRAIRF